MKNVLTVFVLAAAASAAGRSSASPAPAEVPAEPAATAPAIETLVATVLERAPSVAALSEKLAAAREMIAPAGALPDPMVELMLQDVSFPSYTVGKMEMSMLGPEVRQSLPFPGKREARRAVARADADVRADELEALRRRMVFQVRGVYAKVYALDQERDTLRAARQLLDMLAATVASRYAVGEAEQEAVVKAQLEVTRLEERRTDLEAERAALVASLNRLLDQPASTPLGAVTALPSPPVPNEPWEDAVLESSADVAAGRAAVVAAERRLELARLDLKPDFTAGAGVGLRGGLDPVVTLRFGVELPLWRKEKQLPMFRAAQHELEMAKAELREAEAAARSEVARLHAAWNQTQQQIVRYRQGVIPQSSAAVDAARASYLAGRGDFLTVVEDFRAWLGARAGVARREADRFTTWAELDALLHDPSTGSDPPGQPVPVPQPPSAADEAHSESRPAGHAPATGDALVPDPRSGGVR